MKLGRQIPATALLYWLTALCKYIKNSVANRRLAVILNWYLQRHAVRLGRKAKDVGRHFAGGRKSFPQGKLRGKPSH